MVSSVVFSQRIKTEKVIQTSDSILKSEVGERIFKSFEISVGSYYKYQTKSKYVSYGKFLSKRSFKKNTTEIWILYHFRHGNLKAGMWLKLNAELKPIEPLELNFIPEFLKNNEPSNFITYEKAQQIATDSFRKNSLEVDNPKLIFDDKKGKYIYLIISKITKTKNQIGQDAGETEIVEIDALDGKVSDISTGHYGLIIR